MIIFFIGWAVLSGIVDVPSRIPAVWRFFLKQLIVSEKNTISFLLIWIALAFINVVMQELLVRGYIYQLLKKDYNILFACSNYGSCSMEYCLSNISWMCKSCRGLSSYVHLDIFTKHTSIMWRI